MGLKPDDYVLRGSVPEWLPAAIRRWLRDLTYREWHAMLLGLVGAPLGVGWTTGLVGRLVVAGVGGVLLWAVVARLTPSETVLDRLVSREPWYFVVPFVAWLLAGGLVGVVV